MPIQNFDFPGVAFRQTFDPAPANALATLGVVCVGTQYQLHKADSEDAVQLADFDYSDTAGAQATLTPTVGGTIDLAPATQHLVVKNGAFVYTAIDDDIDSTGVANRVIAFAVPIADGNGFEAGADFGSRGARIGDPVRVTGTGTGTVEPVLTTILRIDFVTGVGMAKILVGDLGGITTVTKVEFCVSMDKTYEAGSATFSVSEAGGVYTLTVQGGLTAQIEELLGISGTLIGGDFYIEYRESVQQYVNKLGIISSDTEIEKILGTPCADNPLALSVKFAFSTAGNVVYFTGVRSETVAGYEEAIDFLAKYYGMYSVCPATEDSSIIKACDAICRTQSTDEESTIRRAVWYAVTGTPAPVIWEGTGDFSGSTTVTVALTPAAFISTALRTGDKLQLKAAPYTQWDIVGISGDSVTLAAGSTAPSVTSDVALKIVRTKPTNADIIDDINARRCTQSERAVCVWADGLQYNGEDLPNYPLAAAAAGMRCAEAPHRPLSNLGYDFFTLSEPFGMTKNQLKRIGANGIWIIANNQDGTPVNMRQVTTAIANNINLDEESVIANVDTIALAACQIGRGYVGNSNISPSLLLALECDLRLVMDRFLVNETGSVYIGPQLLGWELLSIYQDPVNQDHVYANFTCTPPRPFNKFIMTMRVI